MKHPPPRGAAGRRRKSSWRWLQRPIFCASCLRSCLIPACLAVEVMEEVAGRLWEALAGLCSPGKEGREGAGSAPCYPHLKWPLGDPGP